MAPFLILLLLLLLSLSPANSRQQSSPLPPQSPSPPAPARARESAEYSKNNKALTTLTTLTSPQRFIYDTTFNATDTEAEDEFYSIDEIKINKSTQIITQPVKDNPSIHSPTFSHASPLYKPQSSNKSSKKNNFKQTKNFHLLTLLPHLLTYLQKKHTKILTPLKEDFTFKGYGISFYKSLLDPTSFGLSFRLPLTQNFITLYARPHLPSLNTSVACYIGKKGLTLGLFFSLSIPVEIVKLIALFVYKVCWNLINPPTNYVYLRDYYPSRIQQQPLQNSDRVDMRGGGESPIELYSPPPSYLLHSQDIQRRMGLSFSYRWNSQRGFELRVAPWIMWLPSLEWIFRLYCKVLTRIHQRNINEVIRKVMKSKHFAFFLEHTASLGVSLGVFKRDEEKEKTASVIYSLSSFQVEEIRELVTSVFGDKKWKNEKNRKVKDICVGKKRIGSNPVARDEKPIVFERRVNYDVVKIDRTDNAVADAVTVANNNFSVRSLSASAGGGGEEASDVAVDVGLASKDVETVPIRDRDGEDDDLTCSDNEGNGVEKDEGKLS